jgi:hypothetical protein
MSRTPVNSRPPAPSPIVAQENRGMKRHLEDEGVVEDIETKKSKLENGEECGKTEVEDEEVEDEEVEDEEEDSEDEDEDEDEDTKDVTSEMQVQLLVTQSQFCS